MKLSDRCRKEARDFYLYDNKDCVEWKAADLLDECERIIQAIAENDLDEPIADGGLTVFDGIKQLSIATLAKLRGD